MRIHKPHLVILTICFVFVGAGVAVTFRKIDVTTAQPRDHHDLAVRESQNVKSQRSPFPETDGLEFERTIVKGAPFSAVLMVEQSQTRSGNVADTRKSFSLIFRDRQGRTRRDQMPPDFTETMLSEQVPLITIINDPVAGYTYMLHSRTNVARRSVYAGQPEQTSNTLTIGSQHSVMSPSRKESMQMLPVPATSNAKQKTSVEARDDASGPRREAIGDRQIEGFTAEGTPVTMTIPVDAIGNDHPLTTSVDRWYSPQLKAVLLIERSDPRFGTIIWRLTRIQRTDPAPAQFTVPNGFKIIPN